MNWESVSEGPNSIIGPLGYGGGGLDVQQISVRGNKINWFLFISFTIFVYLVHFSKSLSGLMLKLNLDNFSSR